MEIKIEGKIYECIDNTLTIYKFGLLGAKKVIWSGDISSLEILFYSPTNKPAVIFVAPDMPQSHGAYVYGSKVDVDGCVSTLYTYLVEHGATERLTNRALAALGKHSVTIEREKAEKQEQKRQKKEEKQREREALNQQQQLEQDNKDTTVKHSLISHIGCKVSKEEKYTCVRCGESWFINDLDKTRNLTNALHFSVYSLNQMKDISRCPKCGSKATRHKTVKVWTDSKGNCVDIQE